jgi:cold shock CspA family protein
MAHGIIATLTERGFGFIRPAAGGADVFFHRSVLEDVVFDELHRGDAVTYTVGADRHRPDVRAAGVRRATNADRDGDGDNLTDETQTEGDHGTIR